MIETQLPAFVLSALKSPPRYHAQFTEDVAALGQKLSGELGVLVKHETDMNYCVGQSLRFETRVKKPGLGARSKGSLFEIMVFISSKAPVFASYCFDRQGLLTTASFPWIAPDLLPDSVRDLRTTAHRVLEAAGLREVEFGLLSLPAPNCSTDMDGVPATVFEALFAEII